MQEPTNIDLFLLGANALGVTFSILGLQSHLSHTKFVAAGTVRAEKTVRPANEKAMKLVNDVMYLGLFYLISTIFVLWDVWAHEDLWRVSVEVSIFLTLTAYAWLFKSYAEYAIRTFLHSVATWVAKHGADLE